MDVNGDHEYDVSTSQREQVDGLLTHACKLQRRFVKVRRLIRNCRAELKDPRPRRASKLRARLVTLMEERKVLEVDIKTKHAELMQMLVAPISQPHPIPEGIISVEPLEDNTTVKKEVEGDV